MNPQENSANTDDPHPLSAYEMSTCKAIENLTDCMTTAENHIGNAIVTRMEKDAALPRGQAAQETHGQMLDGFNDLHSRMSNAHKVALGSAVIALVHARPNVTFVGMNPSFVHKALVGAFLMGAAVGGIASAIVVPKVADKALKTAQHPATAPRPR